MARIDAFAEFAVKTSIAAAAGTTLLGNQIDLSAIREIGDSPLYLNIVCTTAIVTAANAGTIQWSLVSDAQAAIAVDGSQSTHLYTPAFVTDDDPTIPAGTLLFQCALPVTRDWVSKSVAGVFVKTGQGARYEQFIGLATTIATTTITAGAVSAFLTLNCNSWRPYADAVN